VVELYYREAPRACQNFFALAERGKYDNVLFHRVIADFMIQSGDPTGTGRGGESIWGTPFEDEIVPQLKFMGAGILAMVRKECPFARATTCPQANAGKDTNGSQFFITLAPTSWLEGESQHRQCGASGAMCECWRRKAHHFWPRDQGDGRS
jgi:peptidyl-prolyl cis-trans isomerase-like 1